LFFPRYLARRMFYLVGLVCNDTGSNRDRVDVHVAVVDEPALLSGIRIAAAGEHNHAPMIPPIAAGVKPLGVVAAAENGTGAGAGGRLAGPAGAGNITSENLRSALAHHCARLSASSSAP
jgi:hypothetical protein